MGGVEDKDFIASHECILEECTNIARADLICVHLQSVDLRSVLQPRDYLKCEHQPVADPSRSHQPRVDLRIFHKPRDVFMRVIQPKADNKTEHISKADHRTERQSRS